jgi:hypothetical protein
MLIIVEKKITEEKILGDLSLKFSSSPEMKKQEEFIRNLYLKRSEVILTHPKIGNFLKAIDTKIEDSLKQVITPFLFFESSSGMGKTQMAFNLMAHAQSDVNCRSVHYLLMTSPTEISQTIYKPYSAIITCFKDCYDRDMKLVGDSVSIQELSVRSLYTFGFIKALLEGYFQTYYILFCSLSSETGKVSIVQCFSEAITNKFKDSLKKPIFILDEFPKSDNENKSKLHFCRNVFRALHLPLIIMGTNARSPNLISDVYESRSETNTFDWCYLFDLFPPFMLLQEEKPYIPDWLIKILQKSRPLFSHLAILFLRLNPEKKNSSVSSLLNDITDYVANVSYLDKKVFVSISKGVNQGFRAQAHLFMNMSYTENFSEFIHEHFAILSPHSSPITLKLFNNSLYNGKEKWTPKTIFPKFEKDILLYLSLMGTLNYAPFYSELTPDSHINRLSLNKAMSEIQVDASNKLSGLNFLNAVQRSNDGQYYEALFCGALIIASHFNGFEGINGKLFVKKLIEELADVNFSFASKPKSVNDIILCFLEKNVLIPFMSPPNQPVPNEVISLENIQFANIMRTKNIDKIDIKVSDSKVEEQIILTGESKDYGSVLTLPNVTDIILRIPLNL